MNTFLLLTFIGMILLIQMFSQVESRSESTPQEFTSRVEASPRKLSMLRDPNFRKRKELKKLVHHHPRPTVPPPRCLTQPLFLPLPYLKPFPTIIPRGQETPFPPQAYSNNYDYYGPTTSSTTPLPPLLAYPIEDPSIYDPSLLSPPDVQYPRPYFPSCGKGTIVYSINYFDPYRHTED